MASTILQNAEITFEKIYAEENPDLARKFEIQHAPTLIVLGDKVERYSNASDIMMYVEEMQ